MNVGEVFYWFIAFCCLGGLMYFSYQVGRWVQWNDSEKASTEVKRVKPHTTTALTAKTK